MKLYITWHFQAFKRNTLTKHNKIACKKSQIRKNVDNCVDKYSEVWISMPINVKSQQYEGNI